MIKKIVYITMILFAARAVSGESINLSCQFDSDILPLPFDISIENESVTVSVNEGEFGVPCSITSQKEDTYYLLCEGVAQPREAYDAWVIELRVADKKGDFVYRPKEKDTLSPPFSFSCD